MAKEKENFPEFEDDFTGVEAQNDPSIADDDAEFSLDSSMEGLGDEDVTEFENSYTGLDYPNLVILPKKPILAFLRMVESWTKVSIDTYGKSLRIRSLNPETVEISYSNKPTSVAVQVANTSAKIIDTHFMRIEVLKRVAAQATNHICLVEQEGLYLPLGNQLIMCETIKLHDEVFGVVQEGEEASFGGVDVASFTELIKNFNTISAFSERSQDKTIKIYNSNLAQILSPAIRLTANSPFALNTEKFEIPKPLIESLAVVAGSSLGVKYRLTKKGERLYLSVEVGTHISILSQVSPLTTEPVQSSDRSNSFSTDWDAIKQLSKVVTSFDYYNPVIGLALKNSMIVAETRTKDLSKTSFLEFPATSEQISAELKFNSKIITNILSQDIVVEAATFTDKSISFFTKNSEITVSANF